jgi:ATP/maltotriose-dependent transcriptional regulator MalT
MGRVEVMTTAVGASRRRIIKRPRLTSMLDESSARIILLVAPAGYGKTTLAHEWLDEKQAAWYRASPASADVAALAVGLATALAEIIPGAGDRMRQRLRATDRPEEDARVLAEMLAEDLADWPEDAWLAVDDYHFASQAEAGERFLAALTESSRVRVVLTSRQRPSWATARRRVYGEILELGRSELAMSNDEALQALEALGPYQDAAELLSQAAGWPAVIGLAAMTYGLTIDSAHLSSSLSDYFAQELYNAAEPAVRWGLCQLALAPTIDMEVAQFLFGKEAARVVDQGIQSGLLTSIDSRTFEFHPLLRQFLEAESEQFGKETLTRKASELGTFLMSTRRWDDAFALAIRFDLAELLIELIASASAEILDQGRLVTLERWLEHAHDRRINSPSLDLAEALVAFRQGRHVESERLALEAVQSGAPSPQFVSEAYSLAGHSAHLADREDHALQHYQKAEQTAADVKQTRDALWGQLLCALDLERPDADQALTRLEAAGTETPDDRLRLATGKLFLGLRQGTGLEIDVIGERMAAQASDPVVRSSFLNAWVFALAFSSRYSAALEASKLQVDEANHYRLVFALPSAYLNTALALRGLRDFRQAHTWLDKAEASGAAGDGLVGIRLARGLLLASESRDRAAIEVLSKPMPPPTKALQSELLASLALIMLKTGKVDESLALLAEVESLPASVEAQVLASCTRAAAAIQHAEGDAERLAINAFAYAKRTSDFDSLVCAYRIHPELAAQISKIDEARYELGALMERAEDHALAQALGVGPTTEGAAESNLSPRENEVLDLIGEGLSNLEIARTLFISEATAKLHVSRVLEKLGVRTRTQAALLATRRYQGSSDADDL